MRHFHQMLIGLVLCLAVCNTVFAEGKISPPIEPNKISPPIEPGLTVSRTATQVTARGDTPFVLFAKFFGLAFLAK